MTMGQEIDVEAAEREGLTVIYCLNPACRRALMVCDGHKLYLGGRPAVTYDRVRIVCEKSLGGCGQPRTWRPSPSPERRLTGKNGSC
jgi:hypothetical protein